MDLYSLNLNTYDMSAIINVPKLAILMVELQVTSWNNLRTFIWLICRPRFFNDVASNAQSTMVAMSELGRKGRKNYWRLHRPGLETRRLIESACVTLTHGACSKCCTLLLTVVSLSPHNSVIVIAIRNRENTPFSIDVISFFIRNEIVFFEKPWPSQRPFC